MKNILLAPNGKPSNLTPEQYRLVRTPEFKAWFGDWENDAENASKVVDENGEPKVMYHSSDSEFTIFNPEHKSRWINQRKEKAIWFGGNNKVSSYTNNGYLYEVFLYCFNPIIVDAKDYDSWNYYYDENNNKTYDIGRIKGGFITKAKEVKWDGTANNNDGVLFLNAWDNVPLGIVCVVFEPNQIKLADGSNTTFDSNNNDIRFDGGGKVEDLISQGVVELKMFDTKPEHAKEYGLDSVNPLYVQSLCITENQRLKGIGNKVLKYIDDYAIKNGHDVVFGHITQKAEFTKDNRQTFFCDIDMIKNWLHSKGYAINNDNNDFHKIVNNDIRYKKGGRTIAQTPAPKKDRVYGSETNKPESASTEKSGKSIRFSAKTLASIKSIIKGTGISLATAKAVVRRGMGAYSSSHRPTISGGKPNSLVAWGLARLNAFVYKAEHGKSKSGRYSQDNDLLISSGYKISKMDDGGVVNFTKNCIDFIRKTKAIFDNGYYHDFGDFVLIAYNSGGQKGLTVYQTINLLLSNSLAELLNKSDRDCKNLIAEFYDKARRFDNHSIIHELDDKHMIVANRDRIECSTFELNNPDIRYAGGGEISTDLYEKWSDLVNMTASELRAFMATKDGKEAGLTKQEANELGIKSGHESAEWILKMKKTDHAQWTPKMWEWAKRQVSFISRMRGNKGGLYDENGNKTRKHTSLLIWGHDPTKFNGGGKIDENTPIYEMAMDVERDHKITFDKIKLAEKYLASGKYDLAQKIILGNNVSMLLNHFNEEEKYLFPKIMDNSNARLINDLIKQHIKFEAMIQNADSEPNKPLFLATFIVLLKKHMTMEYELIKHLI